MGGLEDEVVVDVSYMYVCRALARKQTDSDRVGLCLLLLLAHSQLLTKCCCSVLVRAVRWFSNLGLEEAKGP